MAITVKVNVDGLKRLEKALINNPTLKRDVSKAWETIYRSFTRLRFHKFSRGGGDWAPLKQSTINARRKGKGSGSPAILVDTGALRASIQPTAGGMLKITPLEPLGFHAKLESSQRSKKGSATLQDVASYQHHGEGHLPARTILVVPDAPTVEKMKATAKRIVVKAAGDR